MHVDILSFLSFIAFSAPFLAIAVILVHYQLRRAAWRRKRRLGKRNLGFCPSSSALGTALQFLQVVYRPNVAYVVKAKQDEDADEDDAGEPETLAKQLHRQLRRIRRGEPVDRLVLRL
jgi:hypothetical protein